MAYLFPHPHHPPPSVGLVAWAMDQLAARGFTRVVTNALSPLEQAGFLQAGFQVRERLHLLTHDLRHLPPQERNGLRAAREEDRPAVLEVDNRSFPCFWRIDHGGLDETLAATPRTRFRLGEGPEGVVAYAVTGRGKGQGFLQRVAVHPDHQRRGLGRALVIDGLAWLRRWRVKRAVVNTPTDNEAALSLYEGLGFRRQPIGLCVLTTELK